MADAFVRAGAAVALEIALYSSPEGELIERAEASDPLLVIHGQGQLLPGIERALAGRAAGDVLRIDLEPEDAYGHRDEELVELVPRANLPDAPDLALGEWFEARAGARVRWARVAGFRADGVLLDLNHPLAGRRLRAEVRVLAVRPATPAELAAGRALPGL